MSADVLPGQLGLPRTNTPDAPARGDVASAFLCVMRGHAAQALQAAEQLNSAAPTAESAKLLVAARTFAAAVDSFAEACR